MDAEEIQIQVQGRGCSKFPRITGNGRAGKIGPDEYDEVDGGENRLRGWHGASRIIRVSRASGGKDRHSKVWTSKGLRDRRVRLSVTTAIQFYDLQDRLGYDQPSKAVEWLIKAAADSISELPALSGSSFPETPNRPNSAEMELDQTQFNISNNNQSNQISVSNKSSSTSETSKGSGLSLSQSEVRVNRVKASRERARERAAKNPIPQNSSFTELLTAGAAASASSAPMDYFTASGSLLGQSSSSSSSKMQAFHHHLANSIPVSPYNHHHPDQLQQFSFVPDHYIPVVSSQQGSDVYNLNFTISPSGGYNSSNSRGTLQSNSQSFLPHHHLQRFGDGSSNVPFFLGGASPGENNHHHQHLQQQHQHIFYGDSKEKGKN